MLFFFILCLFHVGPFLGLLLLDQFWGRLIGTRQKLINQGCTHKTVVMDKKPISTQMNPKQVPLASPHNKDYFVSFDFKSFRLCFRNKIGAKMLKIQKPSKTFSKWKLLLLKDDKVSFEFIFKYIFKQHFWDPFYT